MNGTQKSVKTEDGSEGEGESDAEAEADVDVNGDRKEIDRTFKLRPRNMAN
jgi:hypothetical protein